MAGPPTPPTGDDAPPRLTVADLRVLVSDGAELAKGAALLDAGDLSHLARHGRKLFAEARGSTTYKTQIVFDAGAVDPTRARGRCSCMAARSRPYCKHAAALMVAWQRNPDAFAVAEAPPPGAGGDDKKKKVKAGKVDQAELMRRGVDQVLTVVRELALTGAASLAADRADQVRALGENLREHKLRRLSAKTIGLADLLATSRGGGAVDELGYAELLGDLLLTARKLERHLGGEALEDRHVEELIGKTWGKKDRTPVAGLDLVEVAYLHRETADDFIIRESRLVDLAGTGHYAEKQILPRFLARRTPAKRSYAGKVLRGASGSLYPSYPPRRLDLDAPSVVDLGPADLTRLVDGALPSVGAALALLQEHRRDVFAPDTVPVAIACAMVVAERGRLQLVDDHDAAIALPGDHRVTDRLATALTAAALRVVIGDLGFDGALPTLTPMAVVVDGGRGLQLRPISVADLAGKTDAAEVPGGATHWAAAARALGLSAAAIALGELREELAGLLYAGLPSVTPRRVEAMVARLRELGLGKQADLLASAAARTDAGERLEDVVKLHQVLAIALTRLASAPAIDRAALVASAMYTSVYVRASDEVLAPAVIAARVARGELGRFEAAARYARYYDTVPADALLGHPYPTWADGSATPYVVLAARSAPAQALATARQVLSGAGRLGARKVAPPRMAVLTALRVLEQIGDRASADGEARAQARALLADLVAGYPDATVRALALHTQRRLGEPVLLPTSTAQLGALRVAVLAGATRDERAAAAERLADAGDVEAIPLLRAAHAGDVTTEVRDAAGRALGRLGDGDMVDSFVAALARRRDDHAAARTAAHALGQLGDVRGVDALLAAYESAWLPEVVSEALVAVGPAASAQLVAFLEDRPKLLDRSTARAVIAAQRATDLLPALQARLDELAGAADFVPRATVLLKIVEERTDLAEAVALAIVQVRPGIETEAGRDAATLRRRLAAAAAVGRA